MGMNSIGGYRPFKVPEHLKEPDDFNPEFTPQTLTPQPEKEPDKGNMQPKNPGLLKNPYDEDGNYVGFPEANKNVDWKSFIDSNIDINYW